MSGLQEGKKKRDAHTGTYTQGMLRRLQFAQVDLPSHLIFRPKFGLGQYHQTRTEHGETKRTSAKLAGHRRPPRGNLLLPWVEDRVLLLLRLVVVHLGESEKVCGRERESTKSDLLRAHHGRLRWSGRELGAGTGRI